MSVRLGINKIAESESDFPPLVIPFLTRVDLFQLKKQGLGLPQPGSKSRESDLLLHYFWNNKEAVGVRRRITKGFFIAHGRSNFVHPRHVHQRERVSRWLHAIYIHFLELLDVGQDLSQLGAYLLCLFGREFETGEVGDILDIDFALRHRTHLLLVKFPLDERLNFRECLRRVLPLSMLRDRAAWAGCEHH